MATETPTGPPGGNFPSDPPDAVPNFVGDIHSAIASSLDAAATTVGHVVSGMASAAQGVVLGLAAVPWEVFG